MYRTREMPSCRRGLSDRPNGAPPTLSSRPRPPTFSLRKSAGLLIRPSSLSGQDRLQTFTQAHTRTRIHGLSDPELGGRLVRQWRPGLAFASVLRAGRQDSVGMQIQSVGTSSGL
ncbi:unnamed protein product [Protopolystoma xenopodis]|uniref:Uncharacterized protein n=1 Tax=Protopolystoma xenopodis TaxID=117903 RepID=A0A448XN05_9PLAT|nr:unnamed protein product [Protopolystoma xenopodis]